MPQSRLDPSVMQTLIQQALGTMTPVASHATEDEFQQWAKAHGVTTPDDPREFYDYRSAMRAGAEPNASGHWPSDFKKAGHPNEFVGGFNTRTGERVPGMPQASEQELIRLGWDAEFAKRVSRK